MEHFKHFFVSAPIKVFVKIIKWYSCLINTVHSNYMQKLI